MLLVAVGTTIINVICGGVYCRPLYQAVIGKRINSVSLSMCCCRSVGLVIQKGNTEEWKIPQWIRLRTYRVDCKLMWQMSQTEGSVQGRLLGVFLDYRDWLDD